jgi:TonB family protein
VAEAFPDTAAKREESPDSLFTSANNVSDDSSSAIPEKNSAPVSAPDSLETMKKSYLTCNFGPIRDKVMRELAFPPEAIEKGWHGCLKIAFLVHCDGRIDSIRVLASSGHLVLDQSAVEAVKNAAPYPKSPRKVEIQMPISYRFE